MRWDVFCRVIDNLGDAGVCWRLAAELGARGHAVRLWIDDDAPLRFMAPEGAPGVRVRSWAEAQAQAPGEGLGDVVIEAFGCELPAPIQHALRERSPRAVWINLEYLSAEDYVERSHALPSPQPGGLTKWFYYPGFTPRTGGLLREPGLAVQQAAFDAAAWRQTHGIRLQPGERCVSLFCYDNPRLPQLLQSLGDAPTLLLATPGPAQAALQLPLPPALRVQALPWLTQADYDRLLWSCDLNLVRGEDSIVRAHWAGRPFLWQIYPQHDGAHGPKLEAFLRRWQPGPVVQALHRAWNGLAAWPLARGAPWPASAPWHLPGWLAALQAQPDLVTQLLDFVAAKAAGTGRAG